MSWNYRVLVEKINDELVFSINEVYYDNDTPQGYCNVRRTESEESIEALERELHYQLQAFKRPTLWGGDKFPQEYIPEEKTENEKE